MDAFQEEAGIFMETIEIVHLGNLCRMCAQTCPGLTAVDFTADAELPDKLLKYLKIEVGKDADIMPKHICQDCYIALEGWRKTVDVVAKSKEFFATQLSCLNTQIPSEQETQEAEPVCGVEEETFNCAKCSECFSTFASLVNHELSHLPPPEPKTILRKTRPRLARGRVNFDESSEGSDQEVVEAEIRPPSRNKSRHNPTKNCYAKGQALGCSRCSHTFVEPSEYFEHLNSHSPSEQAVACPVCSVRFATVTDLTEHVQEHLNYESQPVSTFPCGRCTGGPFATRASLQRHLDEAHARQINMPRNPSVPYPCGLCSLGFTEFVDYSKHVQTHVSFRHFPCALCGCRFTKVPYLLEHMKQHADGNSRQISFMCEICPDQVFSSKHNLASHMAKKHRVKSQPRGGAADAYEPAFFGPEPSGVALPCGLCDLEITSCQALAEHVEAEHKKFKHVQCKKCFCKFTKLSYFLEHMAEHFADPEKVLATPCEACDEVFSSKHNLSKHIYKKHRANYARLSAQRQSGIEDSEQREEPFDDIPKFQVERDPKTKLFHCRNCPMTFKGASLLNTHLLEHVPNKCPTCHGLFETREQLKEHLNQTCRRDEKFPCPICGKTLASKQSVRIHVSLHSSERKFVCEVCAKSYRTQSALVSHRNVVHLQRSQFMCHVCARTFSFKLALKRHVMLHMGDLPHKCNFCSKAFVTANLLKIHVAKEHERKITHYCPSCKKGFIDIIGLRRHMRMVCKVPESSIPYIRDRQFVKHTPRSGV